MVDIPDLVKMKYHVAQKSIDKNLTLVKIHDAEIINEQLAGTVKSQFPLPQQNYEGTPKISVDVFKTRIPDLITTLTNFNQAIKLIDDAQLLYVKVHDADIVDNKLAGTVKSQFPLAGGDSVAVDTTVKLDVFKAIVPDVVNNDLEPAKTKIWNGGLAAEVKYIDPLESGKDYIVESQLTPAGTTVPAGTILTINAKEKKIEIIGRVEPETPVATDWREIHIPHKDPGPDPLVNAGERMRIDLEEKARINLGERMQIDPGLKARLDTTKVLETTRVKITGKNKITK